MRHRFHFPPFTFADHRTVKGVREKLLGFERFLELFPDWLGRVVLVQIATVAAGAAEVQGRLGEVLTRVCFVVEGFLLPSLPTSRADQLTLRNSHLLACRLSTSRRTL